MEKLNGKRLGSKEVNDTIIAGIAVREREGTSIKK